MKSYYSSKSFSYTGIKVFVLLPKSLCAGEVLIPSLGVFLRLSIARFKSYLLSLHSRMIFFTVLMHDSAFPFVYWWYGDAFLWIKCQLSLNSLNSMHRNYGPSSDITSSGIPCMEKSFLSSLITTCDVVECNFKTWGKFEK